MITARLIERRWLYRDFDVVTPEGIFKVAYYGRGQGYEEVWLNGEVACHRRSYLWYAPEFEFSIGTLPAVIRVRVWIWLAIRSLSLEVDGRRVYYEGQE